MGTNESRKWNQARTVFERRREIPSGPAADRPRSRLTVKCPQRSCSGVIVRIERYGATVEWALTEPSAQNFGQGLWEVGAHDVGTHFHLFCDLGHETKMWGRDLPKRLQSVVFPADV